MKIQPYKRGGSIDGLNKSEQTMVHAILSIYKNIKGEPVNRAALVHYVNESPIRDLTNDEMDVVRDMIQIACFSGLAKRALFSSVGPYCNSDCFTLIIQQFETADYTTLILRRRDGRLLACWQMDEISITVPLHCHAIKNITLDADLINAVVAQYNHVQEHGWARWQNALEYFNRANTDRDNNLYQVDWVLLCSAMEHILKAGSSATNVADKLAQCIVPAKTIVAKTSNRKLDSWKNREKPLRFEWMMEFYRIRNDFAHGKMTTQKTTAWIPLEHLVLASIAFPLVIKSLLAKAGRYSLTSIDHACITGIEYLANTNDFCKPPEDKSGSEDSHWQRIILERMWDSIQLTTEDLEKYGPFLEEKPGEI